MIPNILFWKKNGKFDLFVLDHSALSDIKYRPVRIKGFESLVQFPKLSQITCSIAYPFMKCLFFLSLTLSNLMRKKKEVEKEQMTYYSLLAERGQHEGCFDMFSLVGYSSVIDLPNKG